MDDDLWAELKVGKPTNNPDHHVLILDCSTPGGTLVAMLQFVIPDQLQQVLAFLVGFGLFGFDVGADLEEDEFGDC